MSHQQMTPNGSETKCSDISASAHLHGQALEMLARRSEQVEQGNSAGELEVTHPRKHKPPSFASASNCCKGFRGHSVSFAFCTPNMP